MVKKYSKRAMAILLSLVILLSVNVVQVLASIIENDTDTANTPAYTVGSSPSEYVEPEYARADYMTEQQYKNLGFSSLNDPESFDENDSSNPFEGYTVSVLSELYMGRGGYSKDYACDASIMENSKSYDGLNIDSLSNNILASNDCYINDAADNGKWQYQSSVTVAVKLGDLSSGEYIPDSIIQNSIYVQDKDSCQSLVLYKYNSENNSMIYESQSDWTLEEGNKFVADIEVQESSGYQAITVGDFDGDNYNEIAVYSSNSDKPVIEIFEQSIVNGKVNLVHNSSNDIVLSDISTHFANTDGTNRPLVNLSTTDIAGRDDLVVCVTLPYSNDDDFCHGGCTAIYSWSGNTPKMVYKDYMEYDGYRMKFTASATMDINGDGNGELVVASNKNTNYKDGSSRGDMSKDENLINVVLWSESNNKYYNAWSQPQTVEALDFIKKDKDRKEPVAITGTKFNATNEKETLFVEGVFYSFAQGSGETAEEQITNGSFAVTKKFTDSTGNNNSFIHLAQSASFVEDNRLSEQTLVVYGDEYSADRDKIYLDIFWCYSDGTDITINCSNDNYFSKKNEDDNGTFLTLCPVDVDNDSTYIQYTNKTVGWSNPQVYSVMLSVPYWSELDYGSSGTARGETSYSITTGSSSSFTHSENFSLGCSVAITNSVSFLGSGGKFGFSVDFAHQYLESFQDTRTKSETITFNAGGGEDYAAVLVVPIVTYHYKTWIPKHTATQDEVDAYLESYGEDGCPKVGDTVEGYFTDMCVNVQLDPAFSTIPLETYNRVIENFNKNEEDAYKLPVIDVDEIYPGRIIGDPSSYAKSIDDIPSIDTTAETTLVGSDLSVGLSNDGNASNAVSTGSSSSSSFGYGFNLKLGLAQAVDVGIDILFVTAESELKLSEAFGAAFSLTWASSNSNNITYSNEYAALPSSAQTGVENGVPVSSYSFTGKLVKWEPESIGTSAEISTDYGEKLITRTSVIGSIVTGADGAPAALPTDLHVSSTTNTTATLRWNNSDNYTRKPDAYKLYFSKSATGDYLPVTENGKEVVIDGNDESYTVTGLSEKTTYYFKLRAYYNVNEASSASILGPYASGTTKGDSAEPTIVDPPADVYTAIGHKAVFSISAIPSNENNTLTYKWQQLVNNGYISEWKDIVDSEANKASFNAAYISEDGLVNDSNAKILDNTVYRCIVTELSADGNDYCSTISRSAVLHIEDHLFNENGFCIDCGAYQPAVKNADGAYQIRNAGNLFWFASLVNGDRTHAYFDEQNQTADGVLIKDIDLESREWSPIMNFSGTFDGDNHTISNFKITDTSECSGLFGKTSGTIKSFTLKGDITLSTDGDKIGGVVGCADGAKISDVASYVNISNTDGELHHIGGVVGYIENNETVVDKCVYYGTLDINNSHDCIGGIVGYTNGGARISNCANHGTVSASKEGAYTGGILGYVNNTNPTLKDCYNYGKVSNGNSTTYCGAIIGWARNYTLSNIDNNYYLDTSSALAFGSGGKSGVTATAKTADEFKSGEVTYLLNHELTDGTQVWYQNIDNGETPDDYPVFDGGTVYYLEYKDSYSNFYSEAPDEFDWDDDDNFIIYTYDDLVRVSQLVRSDYKKYGSADYVLANNIIAPEDSEWTQGIGSVEDNKPFNGTFYGNGHIIASLNVNSPEYGGLFEVIGESGCIKDLYVIDCNFNSSSETAGGITAVNNGTIDHCISGISISSGSLKYDGKSIYWVELNSTVQGGISGGIAGENSGSIIGSRSSANVFGTQCGGIAGVNTGKIYGCANNSSAVGDSTSEVSGGLVGINGGTIESSYNSGYVYGTVKGAVAGKNEYDGLTPTIRNVFYFYFKENVLDAVGTGSTSDIENAVELKSSDGYSESNDFVDMLNDVTDESVVVWVRSDTLNKGYPTIDSEYLNDSVQSAGNNITVKGAMHAELNIRYDICGENDEEFALLASSVGKDKILKAYSVSLTDNDGNYIPAELWCRGLYTISVPVENKNVRFAGISDDGNIVYYEPDSVENGIAVFTVSHPMTFAIVDTSTEVVPSETESTPSEKNTDAGNTENDNTPIQTGAPICSSIMLLVVMLSLAVILIVKRRNRIG